MIKPELLFYAGLRLAGIIFVCLWAAHPSLAQPSFGKTRPVKDSIVDDNRMDVTDLARLVFKKPNLFKRKENSPGPFIVAIPYPGYSIATGFAAVLPINISFYANRDERKQLSFFNSSLVRIKE